MARESKFQSDLISELEELFPDCVILKNDANYIQGFPDLTILYGSKWAVLECKRSLNEQYQPNQEYYIEVLDSMSFSAMICPENREAVLYELKLHFLGSQQTRGPTRIFRRK